MRLIIRTTAVATAVLGYMIALHAIHSPPVDLREHRVTDDLPDDVATTVLEHPSFSPAPKGIVPLDASKQDLTPAVIVAQPLDLTDEQRAALPPLDANTAESDVAKVAAEPTEEQIAAKAAANAEKARKLQEAKAKKKAEREAAAAKG